MDLESSFGTVSFLDYLLLMKNDTFVNHPPLVEVPADNRPLVAPIYQSVKFSFDDVAETMRYLRGERDGFYYSRSSNPTLTQLELLLAQLQERNGCLLVGSGVATIAVTVLSLCKQGDHVLAFVESYGPTRYLVQHVLAKFGVTHSLLSIEDHDATDQSRDQDSGHRASHDACAQHRMSHGHGQYVCWLSQSRRLRRRYLFA
jgi:cystathionine beta-lyase/cystathionine gamma-synthase